jgi:hypothetical protein
MGLFSNWFSRKSAKSNEDALSPRPHHYLFTHRALPQGVWEFNQLGGLLASPQNTAVLPRIWDAVGQQLQPHERLSGRGFETSSHWLGDEHLAFVLTMPPAERQTEAVFACLTTSPAIRYFTLERSLSETEQLVEHVFCEWTPDGTHANFGKCDSGKEAFLKAVCRKLEVAEMIEPPTKQQQKGLSLDGPIVDMSWPPSMSEELEEQDSNWEEEADEASMAGDHARAEALQRKRLEVRMTHQGVENTVATMLHGELIQVLLFDKKFDEAESISRTWWKICRRHRMPAHAETLSAIQTLSHCLQAKQKHSDALSLLTYRAQYSGLMRGIMFPGTASAWKDVEDFQARSLYSPSESA